MSDYTFDCKAFLTFHVTAPDEATARRIVAQAVDELEGCLCVEEEDAAGSAHLNSSSMDGDADLIEVDGEDPEAE